MVDALVVETLELVATADVVEVGVGSELEPVQARTNNRPMTPTTRHCVALTHRIVGACVELLKAMWAASRGGSRPLRALPVQGMGHPSLGSASTRSCDA